MPLQEFLTSPRAARAFMTQIIGFMKDYDVAACRDILDSYAEGGDGGVTFLALRRACNLAGKSETDAKT